MDSGADYGTKKSVRRINLRLMMETDTLFPWCMREAKKVDFLDEDEVLAYALALLDASIWGNTH